MATKGSDESLMPLARLVDSTDLQAFLTELEALVDVVQRRLKRSSEALPDAREAREASVTQLLGGLAQRRDTLVQELVRCVGLRVADADARRTGLEKVDAWATAGVIPADHVTVLEDRLLCAACS